MGEVASVTSGGPSCIRVTRAIFHLLATTLAITVTAVAYQWQSTAIGGADQYGYVTAAGLLRQGDLIVDQDIVRQTPWPGAHGSWTPIGYTEAARGGGAIAPVYAVGLPLLMLALQLPFGFCAGFWVVPVCAGAAVWFTYMLGCRLFDREGLALAGGALLAVSPIFMMQATSPLSDVPATAAWTGGLLLLVIDRPFAAGLAAAVAIAVRPNLAPLAVVLAAWAARRDFRASVDRRYASRAVRLTFGIAPAIVGIAWLNSDVFGSPLRSGYGSLDALYSWKYLWANVSRFSRWAAATDTPIVAFAAVFLFAPAAAVPPVRVPSPRLLLGGFCGVVMLSYLFYLPFDEWVYLRFLLPMWPVVMLLSIAMIDRVIGRWLRRSACRVALGLFVAVLAVHHVTVAVNEHVFARWSDERRYVDVARYIAVTTDPAAVFISWQQSGSIRYYADRLTLNFARLDRAWLDRAVDRLRAMGRRPYIVVEGVEMEAFRRRFSANNRLGSLDWTPLAVFRTPYVAIYDVDRDGRDRRPIEIPSSIDRPARQCSSPAVWPPRLQFQ